MQPDVRSRPEPLEPGVARPVRRRRRCRLAPLLLVSAAYTVGVTVYAAAGGTGWPWLLLSVVPPVTYVVVPLLLTAASVGTRQWRRHLPILVTALLVGMHLLGLNLAALLPTEREAPTAGTALHIASWNTEYWDQTDDPARFYGYLNDHFRDVMMLQEGLNLGADGTSLVPVDVRKEVAAHFPEAHVVQQGELVVLSRFPVDRVVDVGPSVLRVDVETGPAMVVSFYDVHLVTQLDLGRSPFGRSFYEVMADRYRQRNVQIEALAADMQRNPNPTVVAGDFNTSSSMGSIRRVQDMADDAADSSRSLLPLSWNAHQAVPLFRLDWMFLRNGLRSEAFRFVAPDGMSDHDLQDAVIEHV